MTQSSQSSQRIGVVEDDEAVLAAISFALKAEGYRVEGFKDARAFLAQDGIKDFACLVIDLRLPDADGLTLIRGLRSRGLDTPAILVTTQPSRSCRREAAALNTPIVEKPLMGEVLSECIRSLSGA